MLINEIFSSIDGEGIRTGYLTTFIRSYGCNLLCSYCFGVKPGRNVPKLTLVKGRDVGRTNPTAKLPINKAMVGEEIFTLDDNLNLTTTTIKNIIEREVTKWYEINIDGVEYYVTPEHPFFTTRGMVTAENLQVGDMILHSSNTEYSKYRMKYNNPMFNSDTKLKVANSVDYKQLGHKVSATIRQKQEDGTYVPAWDTLSEDRKTEIRLQYSNRMSREGNPNWIPNYTYRNYTDLKQNIKRHPEQYTCEMCGVSGVDKSLYVHHKDECPENDNPENLSVVCSHCHNIIHQRGYNFWVNDRKDNKISYKAIAERNGKEVNSIKLVDITTHKYYGRPYGPKALKVYNISCAPYNTYLVDDMWVHNCDTMYAVDPEAVGETAADNYTSMTIEQIVDECYKLGNGRITFTGGEPLIQKDAPELVAALLEEGYEVNIETNGAVDLPTFEDKLVDILSDDELLNNLIYTLDYKCPSSGMQDKMIMSNIPFLVKGDVLKFVVGSQEDLNAMKAVVDEYVPNPHTFEVFVSPVFGEIEGSEIVDYMKENNMQNVRVQVQLHKIFYNVNQRGV